MASSKVMTSTSPPNPDLPRQCNSSIQHHQQQQHHSSTAPHHHHHHQHQNNQLLLHTTDDQTRSFGSMNMEEILKSIYSDADNCPPPSVDAAVEGGGKGKMMEEVWREIVSGSGGASGSGSGGGGREPEMTLEDFLTKAGAVNEEDVRVSVAVQAAPMEVPVEVTDGFGVETMMNAAAVQFQPGMHMQNVVPGGFAAEVAVGVAPLGFGNGMVAVGGGSGGGGGSRGAAGLARIGGGGGRRKRTMEDTPLDRVSQQKQKRMIKNRESAARSRERKQAYTVELESLVTQLEEENARLLKEEVERNKQRYKQLMENLIPVIEKQRPPRVLRRVNSMSW